MSFPSLYQIRLAATSRSVLVRQVRELPTHELQAADHQAWRRFYRDAPDGDIWHPLPFLTDLVRRIAPVRHCPFVDLACGDAGQICGLPPGLSVIGVDQSPEALARAARRLAAKDMRARLVEAFVESTGIVGNSAGGAISIDVLSSFLDPAPVLAEAFRILAPGAALGVTTFTPEDPLAISVQASTGEPVWIGGFINVFYRLSQVESLMKEAGFDIEHAVSRSDFEDAHLGYRQLPHAHDRAIVVGRKPAV